jgi:pyruvate dehydrogenase E2 component (dihydrolipoamide acetyltransferase)
MSTGVATAGAGPRAPRAALIAVLVVALGFGAAFAVASVTGDSSSGGDAPQATPIEPSSASPKLPAAPPSAGLPELKAPPAPEGGGTAAPAPAAPSAPAPAPAPAPPSGGGGGGPIIEG